MKDSYERRSETCEDIQELLTWNGKQRKDRGPQRRSLALEIRRCTPPQDGEGKVPMPGESLHTVPEIKGENRMAGDTCGNRLIEELAMCANYLA